jgi:hypothetical protein
VVTYQPDPEIEQGKGGANRAHEPEDDREQPQSLGLSAFRQSRRQFLLGGRPDHLQGDSPSRPPNDAVSLCVKGGARKLALQVRAREGLIPDALNGLSNKETTPTTHIPI